MSAIVIKKEKKEYEEIKPPLKKGGAAAGSGGGSVSGSAVGTLGPKAIVEKTQAALKVANEAKQLKLRLKDQNLLMSQKNQHNEGKFTNQIRKSGTAASVELLQANIKDCKTLPYKVGDKRFRVQPPKRYIREIKTPTPPPGLLQQPSKCGEIFVTSNARKWNFVCTFCQKTTRDIGEFVCHIKFKHMLEQYSDIDDYNIDDSFPDQREELNEVFQDDGYDNLDQEYFDCANYLDVSVHTETDESPNNLLKSYITSKAENQTKKKKCNNWQTQNKNNKFVVDLLNDEENEDNTKHANNISQNKKPKFDYEMEEEDNGLEIVDDENNELEIDDDNLLFLRTSSMEDATGDNNSATGKSGSKKYRSHVRGKAYCNLCDKTFQYYSLYRNHMIKHSNITPYKCEYCSKAFKSKQAIRYHMNTHTKEVQYTCPLCPITYGTENQFITHVLNHESDTCFPCMVCAKILKSDQEREEHLSTHTEERPFGCNYCNKRFRQKHHLSNHLKLHCQYRCDFCKEEFSSTQTQRRPYACPSCEEYPEIRIQVEKQRSKSLNNSDVNPLEIINEGGELQSAGNADCVEIASEDDDDHSENSTSLISGSTKQTRVSCQYCTRAYKNFSALNYHMRQKHPHKWRGGK